MVWVIKRQIQKGLHSSTRTVYEWVHKDFGTHAEWTEERIDAAIFTDYEVATVLDLYRRENHTHGRVLCTMKEPVACR